MPGSVVATARCASSSRTCRSSAGAISFAAIVRARSPQLPEMFFERRSMDSTIAPPWRDAGACRVRQAGCIDGVDSRSARTCFARRCCPSAERSASWNRSAALAPVSLPSEVAVSGNRRRRLSPTPSSSATASVSPVAGGDAGSPLSRALPDISGRALADASAAATPRGLSMCSRITVTSTSSAASRACRASSPSPRSRAAGSPWQCSHATRAAAGRSGRCRRCL
jgi:hypothetical protein